MYSYFTLLFYLGLAELLRRCSIVLLRAFTGPLSKIPGPVFMKFTTLLWDMHIINGDKMYMAPKLFKKYGDIVRVGPKLVLVASKSAIQKVIVEEDLIKSPEYERGRNDPKVTNLLTERDKVAYKQKRRLLSPGFSISYLNGLEPLIQQCVQIFAEVLESKCADGKGSAIVDMYTMINNLTWDVMSETSFGGSFELVRTNDSYLRSLILGQLKENALYATLPFLKWLPFLPERKNAEMNRMTDTIISKRRAAKDQSSNDLLQIFLDTHDANPNTFTEDHLKQEMRLFMIAGSDTTGTSTTFALLLLLNNPEKLKALKDEIDIAFPSKDDTITFAKTQDLHYLNAVINETLRVMPIIVSGLSRVTTESTILDHYEIPVGTIVVAWISAMFKDDRIWPDGDAFIPERWLSKYKGVEADRKAFIPFSAGLRNCIGQQFALKEMRIILATLLRRYELLLVPDQSHELRAHFIIPYLKSGKYLVEVKARD